MSKKLQVRIVLAADAAAFSQERAELRDFVKSLNEEGSSVSYELLTQEALEKEEEAGQSFYLLIGQEFGEEENGIFHKVYDRFCRTGAPAMYTYFHRKETDPLTDSVRAFMKELDEEIGHFFNLYEDLDSVKLGILMELARSADLEEAFAINGGSACLNGKKVLSLENLPFYKGNESLQALLKEQKDLADRFEKAAVALAHDAENRDLLVEKEEISRRQKEVFEAVDKREKELRELLLEIARRTGSTQPLTSSEKLAIRELEKGAYDSAQQILRKADRSLAGKPAISMLAADKKVLAGYVSENRLLIKTLMAGGVTAERAEEIRSCWEEILRLTKEYGLDPVQAVEYGSFLQETGEDQRALEVTEILEKLYQIHDADALAISRMLSLKGIILDKLDRPAEAEKAMFRNIRMLRELCLKEEEKYYPELLMACHNLAVFDLNHFGKEEQAARYFQEAREGYEKLSKEDPYRWELWLASTLISEGSLLRRGKRSAGYRQAEKQYLRALDICRKYTAQDVMDAGMELAEACKNLAGLYSVTGNRDRSLQSLEEAIDVLEKMAEKSPFLYEDAWRETQELYYGTVITEKQKKDKGIRETIAKIRELNRSALKHTKKSEIKKRRFYLEKALPFCDQLEEKGIMSIPAADVYHNYSMLLTGSREISFRKKGWDLYTRDRLFEIVPGYCLECIGKDVIWLRDRAIKGEDAEKMLVYADRALDLCKKLPAEMTEQYRFEQVKICDGAAGIYELAGELARAEELYESVKERLLSADQTEKEKEILTIADQHLRNLYLRGSDLENTIPERYSEEELNRIIDSFEKEADGNPAAKAMISLYMDKIRKMSGEMKYYSLYKQFKTFNTLSRKKTFADTEWYLQTCKVLLQQMEEMSPGAYTKDIREIEEKIRQHHKKWRK